MTRRLLATGALLLAACQDASAPTRPLSPATPTAASRSTAPIPGHYIVVFNKSVVDESGLAQSLIAAHNGTLEFTYHHALKGFAAALSADAAAALSANP